MPPETFKRKRRAAETADEPIPKRAKRSKTDQQSPATTQSSSSRFVYDRLPDPALYIRLIRQKTPTSKETGNSTHLTFELMVPRRERAPPYIALSYCWGPTEADPAASQGQHVLLQDSGLPVRKNLHDALEAGCIDDGAWAWIDAICINQEDDEEKSHQVNRMREIFSSAYKTVAWLGSNGEEGMSILFDKAREFAARRDEYPSHAQWCEANARTLDTMPKFVSDFLGYEYWYRLWVLQEIVVSAEITVLCGRVCLPLEAVIAMLDSLPYLNTQPSGTGADGIEEMMIRETLNNSRSLKAILDVRQDLERSGGPLDLPGLLHLSRDVLHASDARDRLFGVLGLVAVPDALCADYGKTVARVFTELMCHRLQSEGLDILGEAQAKGPGSPDLPSWVADMSRPGLRSYTKQFTLPFGRDQPMRPLSNMMAGPYFLNVKPRVGVGAAGTDCATLNEYRASGQSLPSLVCDVDSGRLILLGRRLHTIQCVANACSGTTFTSRRVQTWEVMEYKRNRFKAMDKLQSPASADGLTYATGEPLVPFWQAEGDSRSENDYFFPASEVEEGFMIKRQRLSPYSLFRYYWAFLDGSIGPCFRRMCASADHSGCALATRESDTDAFNRQLEFFRADRRAFLAGTTDAALPGIGTVDVREGDVVVLFQGASVPHVIRKSANDTGRYVYIGEAFIDGIMYGEAWKANLPTEEFVLV